jgi:hypothetical protein
MIRHASFVGKVKCIEDEEEKLKVRPVVATTKRQRS